MAPADADEKNPPLDAPPISWRRNLWIIGLSQFLSLTAFSCCLPIAPLYIRELNLVPEDQMRAWVGVFMGSASFALMFFAPVWGVLGDRYGRKMMLVRANLGGAFAIFLMGSAASIETLIGLRLLQGAFTGTTSAAQSLISSTVPERRQGFALGMIVAAVNAGNMSGQFLGGFCAAEFSPANTFRIGGALLFISFLLVFFGAKERFVPPERMPVEPAAPAAKPARWRPFKQGYWKLAMPVLALSMLNAFAVSLDQPVLPLYIRDLHLFGLAEPTAADEAMVYRMSGTVNGFASLASMLGALWMGRVLDRGLGRRAIFAAILIAALGETLMAFSFNLWMVGSFRALMTFGNGALNSMLAVWLGRASTPQSRGTVFGWAVTARALGWAMAPVCGGLFAGFVDLSPRFADGIGTRSVFVVAGVLFFMHLIWAGRMARRYPPPRGAGQPSVRLHVAPPEPTPGQPSPS